MKTWHKFSLGGALLALGLGAVYLITRGSAGADLLKYVPSSAIMVGKINFDKFAAAQEDLKKINLKDLQKKIAGSGNEDQTDILMRQISMFLEDPAKSGIDLSSAAYFFAEKTERGEATAFIFKLNSESTFYEYVKKTSFLGVEKGLENGVKYVDEGEGVFVSAFEGVGMISANRGDSKSYTDLILHHTRPGSEGNLFTRDLQRSKKQVSLVIKMASFLKTFNQIAHNTINDLINLENMYVESDISFDKGSMDLVSNVRSMNKDDLKLLDISRKSDWNRQAFLNASKDENPPVFFLSASLNIQKILEIIKKAAPDQYAQFMEMPAVQKLEESLSGDVFISRHKLPGHEDLQVRAVLGTRLEAGANKAMVEELSVFAPLLGLQLNSENFLFKDNRIELDMNPKLENLPWTPGKEYNYSVKEEPLFLYMDLAKLEEGPIGGKQALTKLRPVLIASGDPTRMSFKIFGGEKNKNFLATLFELYLDDDEKENVTAIEPHTFQ